MITYSEDYFKNNIEYNNNKPYQQCTLSVMDTIADPDITFDEKGICNYYYEYKQKEKEAVVKGNEGLQQLQKIIDKIKEEGKNKKYDCITGVSGGVDSTYVCYLAKKYNLRPLIVHFDNGWNSEQAVNNIQNIISKLGFDLYTLVVDWNEFKDIQLSYFKAGVIDIEAITDHAIIATMLRLAYENKIKYVLSGSNVVTEATLPKSWIFNKTDHINLLSIHKQFGKIKLKTFPVLNSFKKKLYAFNKVESINPINYVDYNKQLIKETIAKELGWVDYGGKHYESVFTRFYQGYILPNKFGVDKRKAHLSDLVFSEQITKQQALIELQKPIYDAQQMQIDKEFVLKKLDFTEASFDEYLKAKPKSHYDYNYNKGFFKRYPYLSFLKPVKKLFQ